MNTYCSPQWAENGHAYHQSESYPSADASSCTKPTLTWSQSGGTYCGEQQDGHSRSNSLRKLRSNTAGLNASHTTPIIHTEADQSIGTISTSIAADQPVPSTHLSYMEHYSIPKCPDSWNITVPASQHTHRPAVKDGDQRQDNGSRRSRRKRERNGNKKPSDYDGKEVPVGDDRCSHDVTPTNSGVGSSVVCHGGGDLVTPVCSYGCTQAQVAISQRQIDRIIFEHSYSQPVSRVLCEHGYLPHTDLQDGLVRDILPPTSHCETVHPPLNPETEGHSKPSLEEVCKPLLVEGPCKPSLVEGSCKPSLVEGPCKPSLEEVCKPLLVEGPCKPSLLEGSCKPSLVEGPCKPSLVEGPCKPSLVEGSCKPSLVEGPCKPSLEEVCKPLLVEGSCKPSLLEGSCKPSLVEEPCKPSLVEGPCKSSLEEVCKPLLVEGPCKPSLVEGRCKPSLVEGPCKPSLVEGSCKPSLLEGPCKPSLVEGPCKPLLDGSSIIVPSPTMPLPYTPPNGLGLLSGNFSLDLDTEPDTSDDEVATASPQTLVPPTSSIACSTSSFSTVSTRCTEQIGKLRSVAANHIQLRNGRILPSVVSHTSPPKGSRGKEAMSCPSELLFESPISSCESMSDDLEQSLKARGRGLREKTEARDLIRQPGRGERSVQNDHQLRRNTRRGLKMHGLSVHVNKKGKTPAGSAKQMKFKAQKKPFKDFEPEILQTRSRAETATLRRRKEMQVEMEQHELERSLSAQSNLDTSAEQEEEEDMDDCILSVSETTPSSSVMSSSKDTGSKPTCSVESSKDEFPPELIAQCRKVMPARSSGDTALHKVCRNGKYDMARCLIMLEGIDTNAQDHAGWTPLHEAVSAGHMRIAQLLLENGADPNVSATDGTRPLNDAIEIGSLELVKLLIQYGADPTAEFGEKTPLEHAINFERADITDYLENIVSKRSRGKAPVQSSFGRKAIRKLRKEAETSEDEQCHGDLPIDGYTALGINLGPELDYPLFYVSPIVEMCDQPLLPVYNLEVVSGRTARRHNFHMLQDVLPSVGLEDAAQFRELYPHLKTHSMAVRDVITQLKNPSYNQQVSHQWELLHCSVNSDSVEFVPVSSELRTLLGIEVVNMDD